MSQREGKQSAAQEPLRDGGAREGPSPLSLGAPHDGFEVEARAAGEQAARPRGRVGRVSRLHGPNEAQESGSREQTAPEAAGLANVSEVVASPGQPLDPEVRASLEPAFGVDFSQVRIHHGALAGQSAAGVGARAYTVGRHIVFGPGQYRPFTQAGRGLIAHELTHVAQQGPTGQVVQRDLAIAPTTPETEVVVLTAAQIQSAIRLNSVAFTDAAEIGEVRDILGVPREPSVVDEDFVQAVVRYQAANGLTQDGKLGAGTAAVLAREAAAEAEHVEGEAQARLKRVARRLELRGQIEPMSGTLSHMGFTGPDANPTGVVSERINSTDSGMGRGIGIGYTGRRADNTNWLQFINIQMLGFQPGVAAPTFNTGTVQTTGGPVNYSNATTTNWAVDAIPASPAAGPSPLYDVSGGASARTAGRSIRMFDEPGGPTGLPIAQAFAATLTPAANRVVLRMRFDTYTIQNNRPVYHVSYTASTTYDITAGTTGAIQYTARGGGAVTRLPADRRTALDAEYPGNGVL